jgi:predicted DNA-binding protein
MAMFVRLTNEEVERLRALAEAEGRSIQEVARAAVLEYVERRALGRKADDALDVLTPRYRNVLDRLGNDPQRPRRTGST